MWAKLQRAMSRLRWLFLFPVAGCQLVLGFEDHELGPSGSGGSGGAGGSTTTTSSTTVSGSTGSQMTGGGGQAPAVTFGMAEQIGASLGPLTDLAVDGSKVYALSPSSDALLVFSEGQSAPTVVLPGLTSPRGLVFDGGQLYTTATNGTACQLIATSTSGNDSVVISEASATNCYVAVGAEGAKQAASKGAEVRSEAGAGDGTLIGKAYDGSEVPAVIVSGGQYFWVDTLSGELLRSDGDTVQPQHNPPGNQVDTVATMSGPVDLVARAGQVFVVGESGVGSVPATETSGQFSTLTTGAENPRGISADATHVYWADGPSVRAVEVGAEGAQPSILYQGSETPNDTFSRGDAVFFTTQSGKLFRIVKTIE